MPHEVRVGQRNGFDGAFIKVRVDEVRLPTGRTSVREIVEHPGAVGIVAVTEDRHVLLVRQFRYPAGRELLEIPAGTRESGEDPATTARRELIEETGHAAGTLTEIATFFSSPGYSTEQISLFHAANCTSVVHDRDADEPANVVAIPLDELLSLIAPNSDQIADGKTLIGLLWLLRTIAR
jgi:ADP-ribose pyrophosphatase